jgi:hypothetical protein
MIRLAAHVAVTAATRKQVSRVPMRIMIDRRNIPFLTLKRPRRSGLAGPLVFVLFLVNVRKLSHKVGGIVWT